MSYEGTGEWMKLPPPGTVDDPQSKCSRSRSGSREREHGRERRYRGTTRRYSRSTSRDSRSRSRSFDRHSRHRRRRSRSRSYRRRRSRSSSRRRHDRKYRHRRYSRSRSPRRHRRSYSHSASPRRERTRSPSCRSTTSSGSEPGRRPYARHRRAPPPQEEEDSEPVQENSFKNDGSFLEMFKKMQEQQAQASKDQNPEPSASEPKKPQPIFGKRRGGRVLKTGVVEKLKNPGEAGDEPKDAWSMYMKEVTKYREACCDDDSKTRPLLK